MAFSFAVAPISPAIEALRLKARAFLDEARRQGRFTPICSGWMTADPAFSRLCGEQGYIGMTWPAEYGGGGRTNLERFVVGEEMLAAGAPVGAHWIADRQSGPQILRHGSEELRRRVLPGIVRGEIYFAIGMSEPGAGSDLAAIASRAAKVDGGWRLNGRKIWTTHAQVAHYMIGLFRTAPADPARRHAGMSQFVVDLAAAGIHVAPIESSAGKTEFNEVTFDDVFVPDSDVIGVPGEGWGLVTAELAFERSGPERFLSVFPLLAAARDLLEGRTDPAVAAPIGRLIAHLATLREMSASVADRLASGGSVATEAALIKDLGNALEQEMPEVLRGAGGIAPAEGGGDYAAMLADAIRTSPSFTLRGGTPQVLRGIIARDLGLR